MAIPRLKMGVKVTNFQGVEDLGNTVVTSLTGNAGFPTPIPTLAAVQAAIDAVNASIAAWGVVGNRGSHVDYVTLVANTRDLYDLLLTLLDYCMVTANGDLALLLSTGFPLVSDSNPQGVLAAVENLRQLFQATVSIFTPKLKWQKPLLLNSPQNVNFYKIYRGVTAVFADAGFVGTSQKTSFIDTSAAPATKYWYFVRGFNTAGDGVISAPVIVNTPAA